MLGWAQCCLVSADRAPHRVIARLPRAGPTISRNSSAATAVPGAPRRPRAAQCGGSAKDLGSSGELSRNAVKLASAATVFAAANTPLATQSGWPARDLEVFPRMTRKSFRGKKSYRDHAAGKGSPAGATGQRAGSRPATRLNLTALSYHATELPQRKSFRDHVGPAGDGAQRADARHAAPPHALG